MYPGSTLDESEAPSPRHSQPFLISLLHVDSTQLEDSWRWPLSFIIKPNTDTAEYRRPLEISTSEIYTFLHILTIDMK